jgi:hypothetical protein
MEDLRSAVLSDPNRGRRGGLMLRDQQFFFFARQIQSADWTHRVEFDTAEKPATLSLTPTDEAVASIRAALAEVDKFRQTVEKKRADYEASRAEGQQQLQPPAAAQETEK